MSVNEGVVSFKGVEPKSAMAIFKVEWDGAALFSLVESSLMALDLDGKEGEACCIVCCGLSAPWCSCCSCFSSRVSLVTRDFLLLELSSIFSVECSDSVLRLTLVLVTGSGKLIMFFSEFWI